MKTTEDLRITGVTRRFVIIIVAGGLGCIPWLVGLTPLLPTYQVRVEFGKRTADRIV
jgi:hypothetical protein